MNYCGCRSLNHSVFNNHNARSELWNNTYMSLFMSVSVLLRIFSGAIHFTLNGNFEETVRSGPWVRTKNTLSFDKSWICKTLWKNVTFQLYVFTTTLHSKFFHHCFLNQIVSIQSTLFCTYGQGRRNQVCRVCSCTPTFWLLPLVKDQVLYQKHTKCTHRFQWLLPALIAKCNFCQFG